MEIGMTAFNQKIQTLLDKGQGPAARALDKLPRLAQESLAKILGYDYQYPELDSFTKCMMAVQIKQGRIGFIGSDPIDLDGSLIHKCWLYARNQLKLIQ